MPSLNCWPRALPRVTAYPGDVALHEFVAGSITGFSQAHQGLDVMVNNAGVAVAGAVEATPVDDWNWIVGINLLGVVWGCRAALPVMKRQGSGLIFNVASSAGFAAAPQMSAYNATKAGVISLSETLASELAGTGLQVSCAMPGFFRTHLLDHMRAPPEENRLAHRIMDNSGHDPDEAALALARSRGRRRASRRLAAGISLGVAAQALVPALVPQAGAVFPGRSGKKGGSTARMKRV